MNIFHLNAWYAMHMDILLKTVQNPRIATFFKATIKVAVKEGT
jgi:hypothetical protein